MEETAFQGQKINNCYIHSMALTSGRHTHTIIYIFSGYGLQLWFQLKSDSITICYISGNLIRRVSLSIEILCTESIVSRYT